MVNMNVKRVLVTATLLLIVITGLSFSSPALQKQKVISSIRDEKKSNPVHIYYAKDNDRLPESFEFKGTVVDRSPVCACGGVWFGGTLRIKPLKNISGYTPEYVYAIVECLDQIDKDLVGKTVRMRVMKAHPGDTPCNCEEIQNRIESNGVPFYCALKMDIDPSN